MFQTIAKPRRYAAIPKELRYVGSLREILHKPKPLKSCAMSVL